jgi:hypothetical protein
MIGQQDLETPLIYVKTSENQDYLVTISQDKPSLQKQTSNFC